MLERPNTRGMGMYRPEPNVMIVVPGIDCVMALEPRPFES